MAKPITDFEFIVDAIAKSPWDQWFDGRPWQLTQGEDFTEPIPHFLSRAREQGYQRGVRLRTQQLSERTVMIKAMKGLPPHRKNGRSGGKPKRKRGTQSESE